MRLMSQRTVLVRSCHRLSLLHFLWPPFPTTVQQVVQLQNAPALFCTLQVFSKIYFKLTYTQSLHYAVSFSAVSTSVVFDLGHQLISKAIYGLLTSPKKQTDEFVLFAFLLFIASKSNSSGFFGRIYGSPICFLVLSDLQWGNSVLVESPILRRFSLWKVPYAISIS